MEGVGGGSGDPVLRGEVDGFTEGRFGFGPRVDVVVVAFEDVDLCANGEAWDGLLFVGVCWPELPLRPLRKSIGIAPLLPGGELGNVLTTLSFSNTNDSPGAAGMRIGVVRGLPVPGLCSRSPFRLVGYRCIADFASSGISRRESWLSSVEDDAEDAEVRKCDCAVGVDGDLGSDPATMSYADCGRSVKEGSSCSGCLHC